MNKLLNFRKKFALGWRTLKTGLTVMITITLYSYFNLGPATLAALSSVFALRETMENSFLYAKYRIFGNTIGVLVATAIIFFQQSFPALATDTTLSILGGLGVIIVINLCTLTNNHQSIINSVATFLVVLLATPEETWFIYSLHRLFDTVFGTSLALIINKLFPNRYATSKE